MFLKKTKNNKTGRTYLSAVESYRDKETGKSKRSPKTQNELKDWKYRSLFPYMTTERIIKIYDSEKFFNIVKIDPDFEKFYLKHENDFEWNIVTKGHKTNIEHKIKYFKKHLPKAKVVIVLSSLRMISKAKKM